jgi:hypothetical protein
LLMAWGVVDQWLVAERLGPAIHRERADYFSAAGGPGDLIVCTWLEASQTLYYLRERSARTEVETFPRETLSHLGWLENDRKLQLREGELAEQANALLAQAEGAGKKFIWFYLDRAGMAEGEERWRIVQMILESAAARGWRVRYGDAAHREMENRLRIVSMVRDLRMGAADESGTGGDSLR